MVLRNVGKPVIQEGIGEALERDGKVILRFFASRHPGEDRQNLLPVDRHQGFRDSGPGDELAHDRIAVATLPLPDIDENRVAKIEDMQLQPLDLFEIVDKLL